MIGLVVDLSISGQRRVVYSYEDGAERWGLIKCGELRGTQFGFSRNTLVHGVIFRYLVSLYILMRL
jgi:hypothetical protein